MARGSEPPDRQETPLSIPTHVPSVRNGRDHAADRVPQSVAGPDSPLWGADSPMRDCCAGPTECPLPVSKPRGLRQIRESAKASER